MRSFFKGAIAPVYLFSCLVLGGFIGGIWEGMALQLVGLAIIAWAAASPMEEPLPALARPVLVLAIAFIMLVILQQVPLPSSLWPHGGARARLVEDYQLLGQSAPALPISLSPDESLGSMLSIIPPLAIFCAIVRLKAFRPAWLAAALLAGTGASLLIGAIAFSARPMPWHAYPNTKATMGIGLLADHDHLVSLLVIALPFVVAMAAVGKSLGRRSWALFFLVVVLILALIDVGSRGSSGNQDPSSSVPQREIILKTTGKAITDSMPLGTGLGSFARVYRLYERPETVTAEPVIHARNDYAEVALELGVPGIILTLLFLAWWGRAVWAVWQKEEGGPFTRASSIASGGILVLSLVDFPLRTTAISTSFAMCLALLAERRALSMQEERDLRPARHLVFG